jgi:hypothetical protein
VSRRTWQEAITGVTYGALFAMIVLYVTGYPWGF